jgi:mycothiol synthase
VLARPDALDDATRRAVRELAAAVQDEDGAPPLSDDALAALASVGIDHLVLADGDAVVGYAQRSGGHAEVVARRGQVDALLDAVDRPGLLVWSHGVRSRLADALERRGYERARVLHRLERPLEEPVAVRPLPDGVTVSTFRIGVDEDDWLRVNAAAFALHPEQGSWTAADLVAREQEPWFDPAGFFLARRGQRVVGFHWTKVHPDGAGEVYVLGIDPGAQGGGLGAALLTVGLEHLRQRGCPRVLLYVDESNTAAMRLYERYGFTSADRDVQWRRP